MAALVWKHGTTKDAAKQAVVEELQQLGVADKIKWSGDRATASIGLGMILSASGEVTDDAVVLEKAGGAAGGTVVQRCRELLERLFPGGEAG
jgi:hypothetical protein